MKKFLYLCGMMLFCTDIMAQIDLNDQNWDWNNSFIEEFNTSQSWNSTTWFSSPNQVWKAYMDNKITHGNGSEHQIFQYDHSLFDVANGEMRFVAEYDTVGIMNHQYALPNVLHGNYPNVYGQTDGLLYFSGAIQALRTFRYGYFEIRCKIPVHHGAFPAFWLHSSSGTPGNSFYASLDIFEYGWSITVPWGENPTPPEIGSKRCYTCGIHFNNTTNHSGNEDKFGKAYPIIPSWCSDLDNFHTFSCEWMPDHVVWYFDGVEMNRYDDPAHIPNRNLTLRANYGIDNYYTYGGLWTGPGEMLIDYIRVYQLIWDCTTDEVITCQSDLNGFDYAVKKSISITSTLGEPVVSSSDKKTFRVTDSFVVTGPFTVNNGAEFTVIKQLCPPDE